MSIFSASTNDLDQTGKTIRNLGDDYKYNISEIFKVINNLGVKWSGEASDKYVTTFNSYKPDLDCLGDAIVGMGNALSNAASTFATNEEDLKAQAGRL